MEVDTFIRQATPSVQVVLRELRTLVREVLPAAKEEIKWGRPVYRLNGIVCYLAVSDDHASLGFYRGVELEDPRGLLEGNGKKLRHIRVRDREEIRAGEFSSLLHQAAELDQTRMRTIDEESTS